MTIFSDAIATANAEHGKLLAYVDLAERKLTSIAGLVSKPPKIPGWTDSEIDGMVIYRIRDVLQPAGYRPKFTFGFDNHTFFQTDSRSIALTMRYWTDYDRIEGLYQFTYDSLTKPLRSTRAYQESGELFFIRVQELITQEI